MTNNSEICKCNLSVLPDLLYNMYMLTTLEGRVSMWDGFSRLISYIDPYIQFPWVIQHVIDVSIVAFVLYKLLLLIRETRAEQVQRSCYNASCYQT